MILKPQQPKLIQFKNEYTVYKSFQSYKETFVFKVFSKSKGFGFVHMNKTGQQLFFGKAVQNDYQIQMINSHLVLLVQNESHIMQIINLKTHQTKLIFHKPKLTIEIFTFPQTQLFCLFGDMKICQYSLIYYRYPNFNTACTKNQDFNQSDFHEQQLVQKQFLDIQQGPIFKGNDHSMIIIFQKVFFSWDLKFTIFQKQRETISEDWQCIKYEIPFYSKFGLDKQLFFYQIQAAFQPLQQGYIFLSFEAYFLKFEQNSQEQLTKLIERHLYFVELDERIIQQADLGILSVSKYAQEKFPQFYYSFVKTMENNVILLEIQQPKIGSLIVKKMRLKSLKSAFRQLNKPLSLSYYDEQQLDACSNYTTFQEYTSNTIIQIKKIPQKQEFKTINIRLLDPRQVTLQFMQAINPDFDEDLFQDVIKLMDYEE